MTAPRSPRWLIPLVVSTIAVALVVLVAVPAVVVLAGLRPGSNAPEQTPVVTDAAEVEVAISGFNFSPRDLTIGAGATVTWTNEDSAPHDAAARGNGWRTEILGRDESDTITFDTPGTFEYYCTIHPWMEGTLTVR